MSQQNRDANRRIALIAGIVVALGAIVAGGVWYTTGTSTTSTKTSAPVAVGATSISVGPATAPVKVTIYEDFLCPYCRQLEDETRDFLRENAADGKVRVTYQPINLLQQYAYSARALNAWAAVLKNSTPQAALSLHDLLYENQPYETASDGVSDADLAKLVTQAGADSAAVSTAMKTQDSTFFAAAQQAMVAGKVQGTPTVYLDGKEITGSVSELATQIENAVSAG